MRKPVCSLCDRVGATCVYPTFRKKPPFRKEQSGQASGLIFKDFESGGDPARGASINDVAFDMVDITMQFPAVDQHHPPSNPVPQNNQFFHSDKPTEHTVLPNFSQAAQDDLFFDMALSSTGAGHQNFLRTPVPDIDDARNWDEVLNTVTPMPQEILLYDDRLSVGERSVENTCSASESSTITTFRPSQNGSARGRGRTSFVAEAHKWNESLFSIEIPEDVGNNLLELFFEKIQPAFPLLHRPRVLAEFMKHPSGSRQRFRDLDFDSALLLNGIFALAARFSEMENFWSCEPSMRGDRFGKTAQSLFDVASREEGDDHLSLKYLQGCILLTYFQLTSRPSFQAWVGIGLCCRIAYALSLHQIDRDSENHAPEVRISGKEWTDKEEQRRAWWTIVQMDNFASFIGGRPANIDSARTDVLLPVSDEAWFVSRPVRSALISKGTANAWSSLIDCENQDAYAWFHVANSLCRAAQEEFEKRDRSKGGLSIVQSAIQCFLLSLPPQLRLRKRDMAFREHNSREKNWVISFYLVLQSAKTLVNLGFQAEDSKQFRRERRESAGNEMTSPATSAESPTEQNVLVLEQQLQAVRVWPPEYIVLATPLIANALVGPAAAHSNSAELLSSGNTKEALSALDGRLLEMVLRRFAEYWGIGSFCLDILETLKSPEPTEEIKSKGLGITWAQATVQRAKYLKSSPTDWTA